MYKLETISRSIHSLLAPRIESLKGKRARSLEISGETFSSEKPSPSIPSFRDSCERKSLHVSTNGDKREKVEGGRWINGRIRKVFEGSGRIYIVIPVRWCYGLAHPRAAGARCPCTMFVQQVALCRRPPSNGWPRGRKGPPVSRASPSSSWPILSICLGKERIRWEKILLKILSSRIIIIIILGSNRIARGEGRDRPTNWTGIPLPRH